MPRISRLAALRTASTAANARELRSSMTDAEQRVWYYLRAKRFEGRKFRRQVPLGPYIVDFLCEQAGLVVEIDGGQHDASRAYDQDRTSWLNSHGYRVLRFWNNEVMRNMEGVGDAISRALGRRC